MLGNAQEILKIEIDDDDDFLNHTFTHDDSPVEDNEEDNIHLPAINLSNVQVPVENNSSLPMVRIADGNVKDWLEEMIEFSNAITRQMSDTLNRIHLDFMRSGMKFDNDFRDHFFYIVNNR